MDRLPSATAERKRWPPVSIAQKRVDPRLFDNAHNAYAATRTTLWESSSGAAKRGMRKITAKSPKHYDRRREPVESRTLSSGKPTNPVHHSPLAFCLTHPTSHKSSDHADGTILSAGAGVQLWSCISRTSVRSFASQRGE
jgi:hypothetical protein